MYRRWSEEHRAKVAARRAQVAELTLQGLSLRQIGVALNLPEHTVRNDRVTTGTSRKHTGAEERRQRVVELTRQGMSLMLIADILKVTDRTVIRDRKAAGISRPLAPEITAEELTLAEKLLRDGASIAEAARTIGRHPWSLHKKFPQYAWTRQQCGEYAALCHRIGLQGLHG